MNIIEKIKSDNEDTLSLDSLRNTIKIMIDKNFEDDLRMTDEILEKVEYMIESIIIRTFRDEPLEDIMFENIETIIKTSSKTFLFGNGLIDIESHSLNKVLWNCIFDYIDCQYFCDTSEIEEMLEECPILNHILDTEMLMESGRVPDYGYDSISIDNLKDGITEYITYYFKDKLNN